MIKGQAHVYGDHINTDLIIAGKYTKTLDVNDLAKHCLEDLDPEFIKRITPGDFLVAGINFGCGSSREQAPLSLKYAGVGAVLAKSFARIFYRNAINLGMPVIVCDTKQIAINDSLEIDLDKGVVIINNKKSIVCEPLPKIIRNILGCGGLSAYLKKNGTFIL